MNMMDENIKSTTCIVSHTYTLFYVLWISNCVRWQAMFMRRSGVSGYPNSRKNTLADVHMDKKCWEKMCIWHMPKLQP